MSSTKTRIAAKKKQDAGSTRVLSESDILRLKGRACFTAAQPAQRELLEELEARAILVDPSEIPPDVITMNTTVECVRTGSDEVYQWTLVYPSDADYGQGRVSVLSPTGIALLGARCGQTVTSHLPNGETIRYSIRKILHQPESSHFRE